MTKGQVAFLTAILTSAFWLVVAAVGAAVWLLVRSSVMPDSPAVSLDGILPMEEPDFAVAADYPAEVGVGDEVTIAVTVGNTGNATATVGSIDVYDSFLDAFEVVAVEPAPTDTTSIFDFTTFSFSQPIEAGGEWNVSFRLKAREEGEFEGDLDVCDPDENFVTEVLSIRIEP